ncbi:hypothetical protein SCYAM73S_08688 [Streptomyces cyaneofuscatus]
MVSGGAGRKPPLVSRATSASSSQSKKSRSLRWPSSSLTSSSYAAERVSGTMCRSSAPTLRSSSSGESPSASVRVKLMS